MTSRRPKGLKKNLKNFRNNKMDNVQPSFKTSRLIRTLNISILDLVYIL